MNKKIKLIWDFRGPDSQKIAEHHCVHLKEFTTIEKLTFYEIDSEILSEFYSVAYIVVDEKEMPAFRDALRPHREQKVN